MPLDEHPDLEVEGVEALALVPEARLVHPTLEDRHRARVGE